MDHLKKIQMYLKRFLYLRYFHNLFKSYTKFNEHIKYPNKIMFQLIFLKIFQFFLKFLKILFENL